MWCIHYHDHDDDADHDDDDDDDDDVQASGSQLRGVMSELCPTVSVVPQS